MKVWERMEPGGRRLKYLNKHEGQGGKFEGLKEHEGLKSMRGGGRGFKK